jgi:arylformamidase
LDSKYEDRNPLGPDDVFDLSLVLDSNLTVYPGDPVMRLRRVKHADHDGLNLSILHLSTHSGTHVDVPLHFVPDGDDTARFSVHHFVGEAVFVDAPKGPRDRITAEDLVGRGIRRGDIVIVSTGWEKQLGNASFLTDAPGFSPEAARWLVGAGVKAVGCDLLSVDPPEDEAMTVHHLLLEAGIGIVEMLANLGSLAGRRLFFVAAPLRIAGGDGSPVRALAFPLQEESGTGQGK